MRRRRLRPEERDLWQRVADSAEPLHPARRRPIQDAPSPPKRPKEKPADPQPIQQFRIGEEVRKDRGGHDILPDLSQQISAAPVRMDRKAHQRLRRGRMDPEARIDLHGMTLDEAHPALISFILSSRASGRRLVLVITGKGRKSGDEGPIPQRRGVLRHQVPHWLRTPPLSGAVLQISEAHLKHGGAGAFYVYLRRSR